MSSPIPPNRKPSTVSIRVTAAEKKQIELAAALEQSTTSDLLRAIVLPAVLDRASRGLRRAGGADA